MKDSVSYRLDQFVQNCWHTLIYGATLAEALSRVNEYQREFPSARFRIIEIGSKVVWQTQLAKGPANE